MYEQLLSRGTVESERSFFELCIYRQNMGWLMSTLIGFVCLTALSEIPTWPGL